MAPLPSPRYAVATDAGGGRVGGGKRATGWFNKNVKYKVAGRGTDVLGNK